MAVNSQVTQVTDGGDEGRGVAQPTRGAAVRGLRPRRPRMRWCAAVRGLRGPRMRWCAAARAAVRGLFVVGRVDVVCCSHLTMK